MPRRTIMSEIEINTGNVYTDIGCANSDEMVVKAHLATSIKKILLSRDLTQKQVAKLLGLSQPKVSQLLRGHFRGISEAKLMDCIVRLGRDVHIVIGPEQQTGQYGRIEVIQA